MNHRCFRYIVRSIVLFKKGKIRERSVGRVAKQFTQGEVDYFLAGTIDEALTRLSFSKITLIYEARISGPVCFFYSELNV